MELCKHNIYMSNRQDIIIIGAGLSGLTLGYLLSKHGKSIKILESSNRIGGRIQTVMGKLGTPLELGATWFSDEHPNLLALLEELDIKKFPQYSDGISLFQTKSFEPAQEFYVPGSNTPSYRIVDGTQKLTDRLLEYLPANTVILNNKVTALRKVADAILVETSTGDSYVAAKVIICIPPQLAGASIQFSPALPDPVQLLLPKVQTWMAGAIKFVIEYPKRFWQENGYSGMLYSHAGIITEMYDHTNFPESKYGFTGFLNGGASAFTAEVRKELVIAQLTGLLGQGAASLSDYRDKIWTDEHIISGSQPIQRPHQNNGHPLFQQTFYEDTLMFCGTETSTEHPGYMEGAILSASSCFQRIVS